MMFYFFRYSFVEYFFDYQNEDDAIYNESNICISCVNKIRIIFGRQMYNTYTGVAFNHCSKSNILKVF